LRQDCRWQCRHLILLKTSEAPNRVSLSTCSSLDMQ
jgi:hypothetical protein